MRLSEDARVRILKILLRIAGACIVMAFPTLLMPVEWMAVVHERVGLGEFPRAPVVDYLARSTAGLYGFHGVLLLVVSTDPVRFSPIVTYVGALNVIFGLMLIAIDLHAGMPPIWSMLEGPPIIAFGIVLFVLNGRSLRSQTGDGVHGE
jgi:hypothetical protein